jgi:hypothetical protein
MTRAPTLFTDDGERELPFKWKLCGHCDGHGKSSAYLGAFTREELEDEGPEFIEDYFSGHYDRACDDCGGSGKIKVPDYTRISKSDRKAYEQQEREIAETRAIERQERLFEGGWREEGWYGR